MSVTRDKKGRAGKWHVHVKTRGPDGRVREKKKVYTGSKSGALRFERELRQNLESGTYHEDAEEVPTVAAFAETYLKDAARANLSPLTVDRKRSALNAHIIPVLGRVPVDQLSIGHARRLVASVELSGGGAGIVRNVLQALSNLSRCAVTWGYRDAPIETPTVRYRPKDIDPLSDDEVEALLRQVGLSRMRVGVLLALEAGLRVGEVLGVRWGDIKGETLHVRRQRSRDGTPRPPKTGEARSVPITARLAAELERARHDTPLGLYVVTKQDGRPIAYDTAKGYLRYHSQRAGRTVGWHVLRHTYTTRMLRAGVDIRTAQVLLGHGDIATTQRYAHVVPDLLTDAAERLGRYWGDGDEGEPASPHKDRG